MTAEKRDTDGNIQAARKALDLAIHQLCNPQPKTADDGRIHWVDSWYVQLEESVPGEKQHGTGISRSEPPLWTDAVDLLNVIKAQVSAWEPHWPLQLPSMWPWAYDDEYPTILRLRILNQRRWRPQDTRTVDSYAATIVGWVKQISDLLNPAPHWHLPNPCPACNTRWVYRMSAGERVRQPALRIGEHGCQCGQCGQVWAPQYFAHLANVLGYELPEGVLE